MRSIPVSDFSDNPSKFLKKTQLSKQDILITTQEGDDLAIVQSMTSYDKERERQKFMKAITRGLIDIREDKTLSLEEIKNELHIRETN